MVANFGWTNTTTATTLNPNYYTIGTTSTSQQIGWNGATVRIVDTGPSLPEPKDEGPLDWLRRRVDECRVDLLEAA